MKKCNARGSAARDPHGIKQITVGPPHGIKQITMFIRENVECLDSSFTTTTTIKSRARSVTYGTYITSTVWLTVFYSGIPQNRSAVQDEHKRRSMHNITKNLCRL
ncbi:hypothetical protein J6590_071414 [Homalodisca vitripennis]|nr:hypothetical protein J6590_071414 [Homalodisca vitripennis]